MFFRTTVFNYLTILIVLTKKKHSWRNALLANKKTVIVSLWAALLRMYSTTNANLIIKVIIRRTSNLSNLRKTSWELLLVAKSCFWTFQFEVQSPVSTRRRFNIDSTSSDVESTLRRRRVLAGSVYCHKMMEINKCCWKVVFTDFLIHEVMNNLTVKR